MAACHKASSQRQGSPFQAAATMIHLRRDRKLGAIAAQDLA
jgi:hypothetical protein